MNTFLQFPPARRLLAFQQVDAAMGLQAVSVEKDFWVCRTLRELFNLPKTVVAIEFEFLDFHSMTSQCPVFFGPMRFRCPEAFSLAIALMTVVRSFWVNWAKSS